MSPLTHGLGGEPPGIKTIFIDFGNVIGFFDHHKATAKLVEFTDMPEEELFRTLYGGPLEEDYEHGRITTADYVREAMKAGRLTCSEDHFVDAVQSIFTPNPEMIDLIPRLKPKYRLILASNTTELHYQKYCGQFSTVLSRFDMRCPSHHVGHRKPAEEYYQHCHRFAAAPHYQCLLIDDISENVNAAKLTIRWKGIVYRPRSGFAEKLESIGIKLS